MNERAYGWLSKLRNIFFLLTRENWYSRSHPSGAMVILLKNKYFESRCVIFAPWFPSVINYHCSTSQHDLNGVPTGKIPLHCLAALFFLIPYKSQSKADKLYLIFFKYLFMVRFFLRPHPSLKYVLFKWEVGQCS